MFFDELDLLELKLETMNDLVNFFVISESTVTFTGNPKELFYEKNKDRFKKFHHKIIHQIVRDTPSDYVNLKEDPNKDAAYNLVVRKLNIQTGWDKTQTHWGRDSFQKEILIRALDNANDKDILLLSDLDEIMRPQALKKVLDNFDYNQLYHFEHEVFYYFLNLQKNECWNKPIATSFESFKKYSFSGMRQNKRGLLVEHGGWHFSFQNGIKSIKDKIEAWGHQEYNTNKIKDGLQANIDRAIKNDKEDGYTSDIFGRLCKFRLRDISDGTFPDHLVEHQNDIYKNYIAK